MTFTSQLLADWDRDVRDGLGLVAETYVGLVRADPATPRDTGALADGIQSDQPHHQVGRSTVDIRSTHRSDRGADVGTILDQSTGRRVDAEDYGHRAFGPFRKPVPTRAGGTTRFLASFRVTTAHVGWWETANRVQHLDRASHQLSKVDL